MIKSHRTQYCSSIQIGQNIAARRRALNISRRKLSSALGYSSGRFIERIEQGASLPAHCVPTIAKELQIKDLHDLFVPNRFLELGD